MNKRIPIIIYEDEDIVAINKAAGMLSIPDREQSEPSLKDLLQQKYDTIASTGAYIPLAENITASVKIFTIHRLDKDTSGLIIFAKNEESHKYYSMLFQERKVEKYYLGIVQGAPIPLMGEIDAPISEHRLQKGMMVIHRDGKASHTSYEVLEANKHYSLVSFQLHTGRTHQIRIHSQHIGHPLVCDPLYGNGQPLLLSSIKKKYKLSRHDDEERPIINRLALHSHKLLFTDRHGKPMELVAEMPKEFRALIQQLKKIG
ncbi:MAG TPA: RluA family pseudouridine synthase [Ferruginibacter sp.]|nr:RluA family pseudouridine synthase [Ferruginibacter sp.]